MSQINVYIRSLDRFGASGMVLTSGGHVLLQFPAGDRHATQTTTHDQLVVMINAIAPAPVKALLDREAPAEFVHTLDGNRFSVRITPSSGKWAVRVEPASETTPVPAAPKAQDFDSKTVPESQVIKPPADRAKEMIIERIKVPSTPPPVAPTPAADTPPAAAKAATPLPKEAAAPLPKAAAPPPKSSPTMPMTETESRRSSDWIDNLLERMIRDGASDLHLATGSAPLFRVHGEICPIEGENTPIDGDFLLEQLMEMTPDKNQREYEDCNDTDFAHGIPGVSRYRVNLFRTRKGPGAVMRAIPFEIPTAEQLGLPDCILELGNLTKGLVLVTGPTGSGKSTTLAALIDNINMTRCAHLITIEDPIEFVHENKKCLVNQREVHTHTKSFKSALRAALREDPDIVLVGEMRDLETVAIAIETAETGHLVFGTLHTNTAPGTVDRIIDQFPPDRQEQIRVMLATSLKGVISQVLCKKIGGGRIAAHEIMLGTSAVENLIREGKTFQLFSIMQTGKSLGMQTMSSSLIALVIAGKVEAHEAYRKAVNKSEFNNMLAQSGIQL